MIALGKLHHVALRVADLDEAARRWALQFGLTERARDAGRVALSCDDEPYALELLAAGGREPGFDHVGWELRARLLAGAGRRPPRRPRRRGGPASTATWSWPTSRATRSHLLPYEPPASRLVAHARPAGPLPVGHPRRLGHVNFLTGRIHEQFAFYRDALGHAADRLARRRRRVAAPQLRAPRDGAGRQGLQPLPPPRPRRRRHRADARRARPPRAPRALAGLGPDAPRGRRQHRLLRAHRRGGVLRRALLRHGAARAPTTSRACGPTTATRPTRGARCRPARTSASTRPRSPPSARAWRCRGCRWHDVAGLHDPAHAERAGEPGAAAAVALRRRLPRRRLLGRPGGWPPRCCPRAWSRTPTRAAARRCSPTGSPARRTATSCWTRSRSHYRECYLVVNALLDGEPVTTCPFIWVDQDFALARGWIQGFPKKLGEVWMTRTYALDVPRRARRARRLALRRDVQRPRPSRRAGARHARAAQRRGLGAHRSADRQRAPLPAPGRRPPRRPAGPRARAVASAATARSRRCGRAAPSWSCCRRRPRSTRCWRRCASAAATASRSPTPSTTCGPSRSSSVTAQATATVAGVEVPTEHWIGGERVASDAHASRRSRRSTAPSWPRSRAADAARRRPRGARRPRRLPGVGGAGAGRPRAVPAPPGRPDRRQRRPAGRGRVRRHGDAAALAARPRDRARRAQLPRLRRPGDRLRGARLALERHLEPRAADAGRAGRGDHAVERAVHALDVEDGARRWPPAARSCSSRPSGRRCRARCWPSWPTRPASRPASSTSCRASARRPAPRWSSHPLVRRVSFTGSPETGRQHRRRRRRATSCRSPPSWAARTRSSSSPTPTSTPRRAKAAGQYDDAGQVCLSGTRLLVEESVREPFLERFHAAVGRARPRRPARRRDDRSRR